MPFDSNFKKLLNDLRDLELKAIYIEQKNTDRNFSYSKYLKSFVNEN